MLTGLSRKPRLPQIDLVRIDRRHPRISNGMLSLNMCFHVGTSKNSLLELPTELLQLIAKKVPTEDIEAALQASPLLTRIFSKDTMRIRISNILSELKESALSKDRLEILALLHLEEVCANFIFYMLAVGSNSTRSARPRPPRPDHCKKNSKD